MTLHGSQTGWGPDKSLTPEGLEEMLEPPVVPADQDLSVHSLFEVAVDLPAPSETDAFVDGGMEWLTEPECYQLLGATGFGRVGVSVAGVPLILPVSFAMVGDDVVFRTGEGTKLDAARAEKIMTFEVDGFDARRRAGWSVLIVGNGEEIDRSELDGRNAERLHPAAPGERHHVVRIRTDMITGRRFASRRS